MRRLPRILPPHRLLSAKSHHDRLSFGFSGAGFLGCYHAGAAACLRRQGLLPHPDDDSSYDANKAPLLTGVSAGSMITSAILAGVYPEPDGMEVVLEAARKTRELASRQKQQQSQQLNGESVPPTTSILMEKFGISLDVLTPGFSLIDQVEGPFRDALVKALGGYCEKDSSNNNVTIHDVDPDLFERRFPNGSLRIGLTKWRDLWPPFPAEQRQLNAYCYVDAFRNLDDVIACSMLSSYIPGITGSLNLKDKAPQFDVMMSSSDDSSNFGIDASGRAGMHLDEMTKLGLVRHGKTGLPIGNNALNGKNDKELEGDADKSNLLSQYWDGGIADVFPTFDNATVIVTPLNGCFDPNPSISPQIPDKNSDLIDADESLDDLGSQTQFSSQSSALLQRFLWPYLPTKFRHCAKSELGLNSKNARTALKMMFSSSDEDLYLRFREGYDDARRFLDEHGQLRVFSG